MEQTEPLKPKFRDLWTEHCGFDDAMIATIADLASVEGSVIVAMLADRAVSRPHAEKVLLILSQHLGKWAALPNIDVPVVEQARSEVVALMARIQEEYDAGQQAMKGLAVGTAQHRFITKRMENMGEQVELLRAAGGDEAVRTFFDEWV